MMEDNSSDKVLQHATEEILNLFLHKQIIIIGAGISGISCAALLHKLGFQNVLILEARNKVGGRINTKHFGSNFIEMGAQWIHGQEGNAIYDLAVSHDLIKYGLPSYMDALFQFSNITDEEEYEAVQHVISFLDNKINELSLQTFHKSDYISVMKYLDFNFQNFLVHYKNKTHMVELITSCYRWYCNLLCELNGCADLNLLSCNLLSSYVDCKGSQTTELKSGYSSIINLISKSLPSDWIITNRSVSLIDWTDFYEKQETDFQSDILNRCRNCEKKPCSIKVHCHSSEIYEADHVIVTVPLGCLKKYAHSMFVPQLSSSKVSAINCIGYDAVDKVYLEFEKPFWKEGDIYNLLLTEDNKSIKEKEEKKLDEDNWVNYINRFAYTPGHPNMLCAWVIGRGAEIFESLTDEEVIYDCVETLKNCLKKSIPKPSKIYRSAWNSDPFSNGSYSYLSIECEKESVSNEDMAEPQFAGYTHDSKPILQFAGEATHSQFFSTVHGAFESGIREAVRLFRFYRPMSLSKSVISWTSSSFWMKDPAILPTALHDNLKIVIIGAGVSGLACALHLAQSCFKNITILEAQEKVGGRVHSLNHDNFVLELGAQWLHGSGSMMYEYCTRNDLLDDPCNDVPSEGAGKFFTSTGKRVSDELVEETRAFLNSIKNDIDAGLHSTDKSIEKIFRESFLSYISRSDDDSEIKEHKKSFLEWYLLFEIIDNAAEELEEISVQSYIDWAQSSDVPYNINTKKGFGSIIDTICSQIPSGIIKLNKHVKRIQWCPTFRRKPYTESFLQGRGSADVPVVLELEDNDTVLADCVVVTSSVGYLKSNMDTLFHPTLPEEKIKAYSNLGFGTINKIYLVFESPFWNKNDLGFQLLWSQKDRVETNEKIWETNPWLLGISGFDVVRKQPNVLVGWIGGKEARMMEDINDSQIGMACASLLRKFLGQSDIPDPVSVYSSRWYSNAFTKGAYSNRTVAFYEAGCTCDDIQRPLSSIYINETGKKVQWPQVMFAGEYTDEHNFSSAHGAFESGWREADRLKMFCENIVLK